MRRRDLINGLAASTVVWPLAVRAQQDRVRHVGVLAGGRRGQSLCASLERCLPGWVSRARLAGG